MQDSTFVLIKRQDTRWQINTFAWVWKKKLILKLKLYDIEYESSNFIIDWSITKLSINISESLWSFYVSRIQYRKKTRLKWNHTNHLFFNLHDSCVYFYVGYSFISMLSVSSLYWGSLETFSSTFILDYFHSYAISINKRNNCVFFQIS